MDSHAIGTIAKELGHLKLDTFKDRLIFQKSIYMLGMFGLDPGAAYGWYKHGPYCNDVTRAGYEMERIKDGLPSKMVFPTDEGKSRYRAFLSFMKDKKHDADRLEICTSIHYLCVSGMIDSLEKNKDKKDKIIDYILDRKPHLKRSDCEQMWEELANAKLIKIEA